MLGTVMKRELEGEDYLKLWMYFEDRAELVKEAMFKTLTWTLGFAAALLGFIGAKLTDFESAKARVPIFVLVAICAGAGLVICLYSMVMLSESATHIRNNWTRAGRCKEQIGHLSEIIAVPRQEGIEIWNQLRFIVVLFAFGFAGLLGWAICNL
jgi:hypothetical protein